MPKARLTLEQKIAQKQQELAQLETRAAEAKRKADNRQKIIIGGTVLAAMREDADFRAQIVALMKQRITRPLDQEAVAEWLSTDSQQG